MNMKPGLNGYKQVGVLFWVCHLFIELRLILRPYFSKMEIDVEQLH